MCNNVYAQIPTITSFTPSSGPIGTTVTITGTNFSTIASNNIVWFGATKAPVSAATATQLTVTVPTGATYQPISVTISGNTACTNPPFTVTFPSSKVFDATAFASKVDFTTTGTGANPSNVAIGDIDGDGKPDLVVTNYTSNTISVFRNTSSSGSLTTGSFAPRIDFTTGTSPNYVAIGDIDGDGKPDLVVANFIGNQVSVFRNTSTPGSITAGSFSPKVDLTAGASPFSVYIGDIDRDGKPDLVVVNYNSGTISVLRNTSTSGSIGASSFAAKVDYTTGTNPYYAAIGDIDGDGKPDVVVANFNSSTVSVLRNTSTPGSITAGSFAAKVDLTTGQGTISVAVGDIDGDGKPDLAVLNSHTNTVSIFRNISTPGSITASSFDTKVDFTTGSSPYSVIMGDIDGDGKPDLAVADFGPSAVSILRNTSSSGAIGVGSFATKVDFDNNIGSWSISLGDIDGDGKPDLAIASTGINFVSVLRNTISDPTAPIVGTITQPTCTVSTGSVILNGLPATGTWTLIKIPGGTTTTGTGTSSTIIGLAAGTYTYTVTNSSGVTSIASSDVVINAQPLPPLAPTVGTITRPTCTISTGSVILNGLPSTGNWTLTVTPGGTTTTGIGTSSTVIALAVGTYTYTVTNATGCTSAESGNVDILLPKAGVIPRIKAKWGDVLICYNLEDSLTSYQWYNGSSVISGANGQYYLTNKQIGSYKVLTMDKNGCKNFSNAISIPISGTKSFSIYPNPASVSFAIKLDDESIGSAVVTILNSAGIKVMEFQFENLSDELLKEIPVSNLNDGIYIVKVLLNHTDLYYRRIVVSK